MKIQNNVERFIPQIDIIRICLIFFKVEIERIKEYGCLLLIVRTYYNKEIYFKYGKKLKLKTM